MKRTDLLKKLSGWGCKLLRNGARHDLFINPKTGKKQPIPRHDDIDENLAKHILKELR
jgi:mRNA interferase HicA